MVGEINLSLFPKSGEFQPLERLKFAIAVNQKRFVTHPSVQQLLAAIWYDGLPGFKRMHFIRYVKVVSMYSMADN